jgi:hypothetical protein
MKHALLLSLSFLAASHDVMAGAFVQKGFSARSSSLGNTYTALSNDVTGIFFNPAGLGEISGLQVQTSFAKLFPGVSDDNLNLFTGGAVFNYPGIGTIGVGGSFLNTQSWKESELAGSYGLALWSGGKTSFSVGGTFRFLQWSAAAAPDEAALSYTGFTVNAGAMFTIKNFMVADEDSYLNSVRFGVHIENLTRPSVSVNGSKDAQLPMNYEGAIAYVSGPYDYTLTAGVAYTESRLRYKMGAEFIIARGDFMGSNASVALRVGGDRDAAANSQGEYTAGFGLVWYSLGIDYAYLYPVELRDVGGTQRISLLYFF